MLRFVSNLTFLADRRLWRCSQLLGPGTGSGDASRSRLLVLGGGDGGSVASRFSVIRMMVLPQLMIRVFSL
jgi:hypothetical protein